MPLLTITDEALATITEIRDGEPSDEEIGLLLEVTGIQATQFRYELSFVPVTDRNPSDVLEQYGDLSVMIRQKDVDSLRDSIINIVDGGLAIDNPNAPSSPSFDGGSFGELTGPLADRVAQVLEQQVNPAIASHGGGAKLIGVEGETVFLELQGGCQGCGMATITLKHGIERIITEAIPEITQVVDVTDHQSGDNPYYQASKK